MPRNTRILFFFFLRNTRILKEKKEKAGLELGTGFRYEFYARVASQAQKYLGPRQWAPPAQAVLDLFQNERQLSDMGWAFRLTNRLIMLGFPNFTNFKYLI